MPETPRKRATEWSSQPPPPVRAGYCELATYDTAILKALIPEFVRGTIPSFATRVECDEAEARRLLDGALASREVAQAQAEAVRRWAARRPAGGGDPAALRAWEAHRPPPLVRPSQWDAMGDGDRRAWEAQVRGWIAAGPEPISPGTVWSAALRYAEDHPTSIVAAGVGLLVAVVAVAASAVGRRR